jgi:hypothetical protein
MIKPAETPRVPGAVPAASIASPQAPRPAMAPGAMQAQPGIAMPRPTT